MKKLFITLFLLAFCVSISGAGVTQDKLKVIARNSAVCGLGNPDSTGKWETEDTEADLFNYNALGQSFQVSKTSTLEQICIYVTYTSDDELEIRIDDDTDLGTAPIENLGVGPTITGTGWACVTSTTNPQLTQGTTYYIAVRTESSDTALNWNFNGPAGYASGTSYNIGTEWLLGDAGGVDYTFRVYLCE